MLQKLADMCQSLFVFYHQTPMHTFILLHTQSQQELWHYLYIIKYIEWLLSFFTKGFLHQFIPFAAPLPVYDALLEAWFGGKEYDPLVHIHEHYHWKTHEWIKFWINFFIKITWQCVHTRTCPLEHTDTEMKSIITFTIETKLFKTLHNK